MFWKFCVLTGAFDMHVVCILITHQNFKLMMAAMLTYLNVSQCLQDSPRISVKLKRLTQIIFVTTVVVLQFSYVIPYRRFFFFGKCDE